MSNFSFIKDSKEDAVFRAEVRTWLAENLPDNLRNWATRPPPELIRPWHKQLYEKGWIAPHWKKIYGGMEATLNQQLILLEEFGSAGAPIISRQALGHIGPILMEYGTEEQKAQHLPKMLTGEVHWCQGYSEPNAGSDLASLRTRADLDGDHFVVNGQKIWTTWGHHAHWMFALVRTDQDAPRKQAGISMILIDLATEGITIRPIRTIADDDEFAEVFFDDVRVPQENIVGEVNDGWRLAKALLDHERIGNASPQFAIDSLDMLKRLARSTGAINDPVFKEKLIRVELDVLAQSAVVAHSVELANANRQIGASSSFIKLLGTNTAQAVGDLMLEAAGQRGAELDAFDTPEGPVEVSGFFREARRNSIYGGTSEIQRTVIAKRVLGLP
ncbi:MAG: acyl-CoA dehydrogenase [Rhodospirillaceae bacterium]|jgi:alkylation response protein AidB-like acyl-CoA dehydrogenase|nr:acyl-CoA dehydrogenase [Rhodospirillaceae bacterium]